MKYIIGIDIGTGSTKAVALDLTYQPVASSQFFYTTDSTREGQSEQQPEMIWDAFTNCINELVDRFKVAPVTIGLSSAMHSLIMVDESGKALAPMMTWADSRSAEEANVLKASPEGMALYEATGTPIHAMSPLSKLIWLRKNKKVLFDTAHKFISIKEYIWFKLFGEYKIDYSIASCTGLFDIHHQTWHKASLRLAGIEERHLSTPVQTNYLVDTRKHTITALNGLDTNFVIGASDGCLANLGSEATTNGIAALTIGTSGALRLASDKPIYNPAGMTFSYILDGQTYVCGGPVNNGGIALQWLMKNVFGKDTLLPEDYKTLFDHVASTAAGSEGLLFLPYLAGERAPLWDSESSGTFFGLKLNHNQNHLSRAVIEGICYALNDVLKTIEDTEVYIKQINVSGGFVHSAVWMQILADITGKKLVLVLEEDASAVGAAYLAAKANGLSTHYPNHKNTAPRTILPNAAAHLEYQKYFVIFKQLYANLGTTMHQLNHLKT
ncbi:gluconokinase [Pedobacter aquatilis]|uniref:gluconokinase n=1 Tax=Pedobacter aquatilis TaxID=351343 RepID=UPI00292CF917|nr:gluconokinase [Pedobacter aquatilis]